MSTQSPTISTLIMELCKIACTTSEIATITHIDEDTLILEYSDIINEGIANAKMSLRRVQMEAALSGNTKMMELLGKNMLGQSDKTEVNQTVSGQVEHIQVSFPTLEDNVVKTIEKGKPDEGV
jgi:hypothetical protein